MRMQYVALKNKPRTLRSLTGFNPPEFEALLPSFGVAWDSFVKETFERADRKRAYGAGRIAHLNLVHLGTSSFGNTSLVVSIRMDG